MEWFSFVEEWFAPLVIHILELVGILIIAIGSFMALVKLIQSKFDFGDRTVRLVLGECLALSLEFKLGAEIIKTVIIHDMQEIIILASVVIIRVVITLMINWELNQMEKEKEAQAITEAREQEA